MAVRRAREGAEKSLAADTSVYRFHLDSPITFTKSLRATIEHGHANHRSDNMFSVAYWYQSEPHAAVSSAAALEERIPRIYPSVGRGMPTSSPETFCHEMHAGSREMAGNRCRVVNGEG